MRQINELYSAALGWWRNMSEQDQNDFIISVLVALFLLCILLYVWSG